MEDPRKTGWNRPRKRVKYRAVIRKRQKLELDLAWLRNWFVLTADEKRVIALIVAIAIVGVIARYLHLRGERADAYEPQGLGLVAQGGMR